MNGRKDPKRKLSCLLTNKWRSEETVKDKQIFLKIYVGFFMLLDFLHPFLLLHSGTPTLATTNLFSVSMNLFFCFVLFLDATCRRDHMVFVFLSLTDFI